MQGATVSIDRYFVDGRFVSPWGLALRDAGGERRLGMETSGTSPRGGVAARPADDVIINGQVRGVAR